MCDKRLEMRVCRDFKGKLKKAAKAEGVTVTDYVVDTVKTRLDKEVGDGKLLKLGEV